MFNKRVSIDIAFAGICGSDINKLKKNINPSIDGLCLGHEIVGRLPEKHGGGYCVINPFICTCQCKDCLYSSIIFCPNISRIGAGDEKSGFSGNIFVPKSNLITVPNCLYPEVGIFSDGVAVILHALHLCHPSSKNRILVIGDGTIGVLYVLVLSSINHNINIDIIVRRKVKADIFLKIFPPNINIISEEEVKNNMYDIVVEAVGGQQTDTLGLATLCAKPSGYLVVLGAFHENLTEWKGLRNVFYKQLHIVGVNSFCISMGDFNKAVSWTYTHEEILEYLITERYFTDINTVTSNFVFGSILLPKTIKGCFYYKT